MLIVTVGLYIC